MSLTIEAGLPWNFPRASKFRLEILCWDQAGSDAPGLRVREASTILVGAPSSCSLLQPAFAAAPPLVARGFGLGSRLGNFSPRAPPACSPWRTPRRALQILAAMNTALVFLKPHAANDLVASFAKKHLGANKVTVLKEGVLEAEEILKAGIIDTHYAALAASAVISEPSALPVSAEKRQEFQSKYGTSWDEAASKGTLLNLAQFQAKNPEMNVQEIEAKWRSGPVMKFAPGNYVSLLQKEGVLVINGFYGARPTPLSLARRTPPIRCTCERTPTHTHNIIHSPPMPWR